MQKRVLLSDATGLIGGELMLILAARGVQSTAVVRASNSQEARVRLLERLQKSVLWQAEFADMVAAEAGDILAPDRWMRPTPPCWNKKSHACDP